MMVDFHPCQRLQMAHWKQRNPIRLVAAEQDEQEAEGPMHQVAEREVERPMG